MRYIYILVLMLLVCSPVFAITQIHTGSGDNLSSKIITQVVHGNHVNGDVTIISQSGDNNQASAGAIYDDEVMTVSLDNNCRIDVINDVINLYEGGKVVIRYNSKTKTLIYNEKLKIKAVKR